MCAGRPCRHDPCPWTHGNSARSIPAGKRTGGRSVYASQLREIDSLRIWLLDWYGREVAADPRFVGQASDLKALQDAPPPMAEAMFLLVMPKHHQSVIDMCRLGLERPLPHEELRGMMERMVDVQRNQQQLFGARVREWYGITPPQPTGDVEAAMRIARDSI